jgi:hypothetical protein
MRGGLLTKTGTHWSKKRPLKKEKLSADQQIETLKEKRDLSTVRADITSLKKESQAFQPELHNDRFKKDEIQKEK